MLNIVIDGYIFPFIKKTPTVSQTTPDHFRIQAQSKGPSPGLLYPVSPDQECNRKGIESEISWVLQSLVSSSKTSSEMEAGQRPKQAKPLYKSRKIQMETPESIRASLIPGQ